MENEQSQTESLQIWNKRLCNPTQEYVSVDNG